MPLSASQNLRDTKTMVTPPCHPINFVQQSPFLTLKSIYHHFSPYIISLPKIHFSKLNIHSHGLVHQFLLKFKQTFWIMNSFSISDGCHRFIVNEIPVGSHKRVNDRCVYLLVTYIIMYVLCNVLSSWVISKSVVYIKF